MSTTITGNVKTLLGAAVISNCFVRFNLRGCNGGQARVSGTALIPPANGTTWYVDIVPDGSGSISGSAYSNDVDIDTSLTPGQHPTWYGVVVYQNGIPGPETPYNLANGTTFNLNTATPLTTIPAISPPTGDATYARLDGGNQPFTGTVLSKNISSVRYADQFSGVDWGAKVAAALADLGSGPGEIDASRFTTTQAISAQLNLNVSNVVIKLPPVVINLGANSIVIPAGTNNVALEGRLPYIVGTRFSYTGSGVALKVGDSTADTNGFVGKNLNIDIGAAGSAAIGIQLNRAVAYVLEYPSVFGLASANTQKLIDLEGGANFTGGVIWQPSPNNGNDGIFFGKNANANWIMGGFASMLATSNVLNFDGGGVNCDGNRIWGIDCENANIAIRLDFATNNRIDIRAETVTTTVSATANSAKNRVAFTGPAASNVTDLGTGNVIEHPTQMRGASGSASIPFWSFEAAPNSGFYNPTGTIIDLTINGADQALWANQLERHGSGRVVGWSSAATPVSATSDVNITRSAAGVLQIGTGETANASGTLKLAAVIGTSLLTAGSLNNVDFLANQGPAGAITGNGSFQTIYTNTLSANQIGAGKGIEIEVIVLHSTGTGSITWKLIFGSTTIESTPITSNANVESDIWQWRIYNNPGVQNAQWWRRTIFFATGAATGAGSARGTAAENTVNSLAVTFQFSAAGTEQVTPQGWTIRLIQ